MVESIISDKRSRDLFSSGRCAFKTFREASRTDETKTPSTGEFISFIFVLAQTKLAQKTKTKQIAAFIYLFTRVVYHFFLWWV